MNFKDYVAGNYKQQIEYKSFSPSLINHEWSWSDPKIGVLLSQASKALGELNAFSLIVPDVDLFIQMHILKEANTSSKIEGTQTEINEAVLDRDEINPEKRDDWHEVQNYVAAMNMAIKELETIPLSNRLLKQTHGVLMQNVRGEHKTPGEFRKSQNWIGGASLKDAVFIPPHNDEVPELMSDMEKFWHNQQIEVPHLIRIAISHYQFETIHPFLDGNGRIGRLLITLYLVHHELLHKPSLYLSEHLERHRSAYYDALMRVRESNDIQHWIQFFLVAVIETASNGRETFLKILKLKEHVESEILSLGRKAPKAKQLLNLLYRKPAITVQQVSKELGITSRPAGELISALESLGILEEITGYRRNRVFLFKDYLDLF